MNDPVLEINNSASLPNVARRACNILIVEDDKEVARAIGEMISYLGYTSCACSHVEEALRLLDSEKIDLMLVDYRMPDLTGLDLVAVLIQEGSTIPVIMITGYAETEERISAEMRGRVTLLKKPVTISQLKSAVEESLRATSPAS